MLLNARPQLLRYRPPTARPCLDCRRRGSNVPATSPPQCFFSSGITARSSQTTSTDATLPNLRIGRHTRVIFQGFTGRQASANARESLAWGTNIVGGVTPGRSGEHLGLPLLPTVRAAVETLKPDATGIYVPAALAPAAIEEAIAAQVPLVVAVAEHIPLHAMLRIHAMLKTQSVTRLVGANSPGIISAVGACRIGFQPLPCFSAGTLGARVGIAARSGTLSYEAVASTTRAGLGQSLCIGVGGDVVAGTDLREALAVLAETDPDSDAIALIGEIGGSSELEAAAWIEAYHRRCRASGNRPKPIVALVAGTHTAVQGRIMGHAGAFALPGEPTAQEKIAALQRAGATIIDHPEKFGAAIKARLEEEKGAVPGSGGGSLFGQPGTTTTQRRGMHMYTSSSLLSGRSTKRPTAAPHAYAQTLLPSTAAQQKRPIYLGQDAAFDLLRKLDVNAVPYDAGHGTKRYLAITVDRSAKSPCVLASPDHGNHANSTSNDDQLRRFPFDYGAGIDDLLASRVADHLQLDSSSSTKGLNHLLRALYTTFLEQEAFLVETAVVVSPSSDIQAVHARLGLDDVAFAQRQARGDEEALRLAAATPPQEVDALETEAKAGGIVYVTLEGAESGKIGTLVNGAGLAMNTVDALAALGGQAANFLDTGGKATSETVKACFQVLLKDPRVRVIFVNVFGGITLGDMIARGVLLAFQEATTSMTVPVVVRIRGTNEAEGQEIIRRSGLPLFAYDSFEEAAAKAISLAEEE